jgi:hypothetical protein
MYDVFMLDMIDVFEKYQHLMFVHQASLYTIVDLIGSPLTNYIPL